MPPSTPRGARAGQGENMGTTDWHATAEHWKQRAEQAEARWQTMFYTLQESREDVTEVNWLSVLREIIAHAQMIPGAQACTVTLAEQLEQAERELDAYKGWIDNNIRRLISLHKGRAFLGEFYESVKTQLERFDAARGKGGSSA